MMDNKKILLITGVAGAILVSVAYFLKKYIINNDEFHKGTTAREEDHFIIANGNNPQSYELMYEYVTFLEKQRGKKRTK